MWALRPEGEANGARLMNETAHNNNTRIASSPTYSGDDWNLEDVSDDGHCPQHRDYELEEVAASGGTGNFGGGQGGVT